MSKLNPQKATAYVGPGVLRRGGKITPVPNGPLIKKKGPFKGSTLKTGGTIKKAQTGNRVPVKSVSTLTPAGTTIDTKPKGRDLTSSEMTRLTSVPKTQKDRSNAVSLMSYNNYVKNPKQGFQKAGLSFDDWNNAERERTMKNSRNNPEPKEERGFFGGSSGPKSPCKGGKCSGLNSSSRNGSTIKKAKAGTKVKKAMMGMGSMFKDNPIYKKTTDLRGKLGSAALGMPGMKPIVKNGSRIKKAQDGEYLTKEGNNYTSTKKVKTKNGPRYYQGSSPRMSFARTIASDKARKINDSIPKVKLSPRALEMMNKKNGGMLKRADGSYSKRGLWDNIRANKGSGKKPTKQMLVQEKKIKAKTKK